MIELSQLPSGPTEVGGHHVVVRFGSAVSGDLQGRAMLHLERWLREQGVPAEVLKETRADDSKLRRSMTALERSKL